MSYRNSHSSINYGQKYKQSYETGYNYWQWTLCEKPILERALRQQAKAGRTKYLDFACGTGRVLTVGETIFEQSTGIDVSETMLAEASEVVSSAKLIQLDISVEPPPEQYDIVSSFRFLNNAERELSHNILTQLHSSIEDKGVLIVNIHRNSAGLLALISRLRGIPVTDDSAKFRSFEYTKELLQESGFEITQTIWYSFLPKLSIYPEWFLKLSFGVIDSTLRLLPAFLKPWAQCFIVVCRKITD